ncbi:hypothetical protein PsorP6_013413 [Peronosclerospora sorghi]|uniref:Uncharacterized protein n=1 Tax=Peronosclerospora sorghi TaxID=230839 RepID=A0ACC0VJN6_9STRA|nr:hypothetical protein PsorP6_013413 [Peronosclerospora sorghi]
MDDPPASLLDQIDTKPSAIQACSKFIVRHQHLHDAICPKFAQAFGCDAVFESTSKYCVRCAQCRQGCACQLSLKGPECINARVGARAVP